jgi:hypothetical protein
MFRSGQQKKNNATDTVNLESYVECRLLPLLVVVVVVVLFDDFILAVVVADGTEAAAVVDQKLKHRTQKQSQ